MVDEQVVLDDPEDCWAGGKYRSWLGPQIHQDWRSVMEGNASTTGSFSEILTQQELIRYLRIPEISRARDHANVIDNLKRYHGLPCIHISKQPLYPLAVVRRWVREKLIEEQR